MSDKKDLGDIIMIGIHEADMSGLMDIAKKQKKTVVEVASDAIRKHVENNLGISESREKRLLTEQK
jgi:hypothetical protein